MGGFNPPNPPVRVSVGFAYYADSNVRLSWQRTLSDTVVHFNLHFPCKSGIINVKSVYGVFSNDAYFAFGQNDRTWRPSLQGRKSSTVYRFQRWSFGFQ